MRMARIVSKKTYGLVWLALLLLLAATFAASRFDLRPFNLAIALAISIAKMAFIILVFMHVKYSRRIVWVFVGAGFLWLGILIELTLSDYLTR